MSKYASQKYMMIFTGMILGLLFTFALPGSASAAVDWPKNYNPNAVGVIERSINWRDSTSSAGCKLTHDAGEAFLAVYAPGTPATVTFTLKTHQAVSGGAVLRWNQSLTSIYRDPADPNYTRPVDCNTHPNIQVRYASDQPGSNVGPVVKGDSTVITLSGGTPMPNIGMTQFIFHLYLTNLQPTGNDLDTVKDVDQGYKYFLSSNNPNISFGTKANRPVSVTGTTSRDMFMDYEVPQYNCTPAMQSGIFMLYDSDNRGPSGSSAQVLWYNDNLTQAKEHYRPIKLDLLADGTSTVPPIKWFPSTPLQKDEGSDYGWYSVAGGGLGHYIGSGAGMDAQGRPTNPLNGIYNSKIDVPGPPYQPVNNASDQTNTLEYLFAPGQNYSMMIYDVGDDNFLTFSVPFDEGPSCAPWSIDGSTTATLPDGTTIINGSPAVTVDVGSTVIFTHEIHNTGPGNTNQNVQAYRYVNNSSAGSFTLNNGAPPFGAPPPPGSQASATYAKVFTTPGRYCEHVAYQPSGKNDLDPNPTHESDVCVIAVAKPVISVYGGDVVTGSDLAAGATCSTSSTAGITTYRSDAASSGGQLAAFAPGAITGFATARALLVPSLVPSGLAFANTSASGDVYGGGFNSVPCITDDWATANPPDGVTAVQLGQLSPGDGLFTLSGGNTIASPVTIQQNIQRIVYVDGSLVIGNNITYIGRGAWANSAQIPAIKFVVRGNIYIQPGVTQLDGIYAASGTIFTCASGNTGAQNTTDGASYTTCSSPLTVNGAFIANKVNFGRTTWQNAGTRVPSEVFNYRPELWLAPWPTDETSGQGGYNAITSLPPVL